MPNSIFNQSSCTLCSGIRATQKVVELSNVLPSFQFLIKLFLFSSLLMKHMKPVVFHST